VVCTECSAINSFRIDDINLGSSKRINTSNRNDYEDQQNFHKFINSFQGITNIPITDSIFEALDTYFRNKKFLPRDVVRAQPFTNVICRGSSNHQMLFKAFSEIGRSDLNTCVNLVGHLYWDWALPDISKYVPTILRHYNKTQYVFYQITNKKRQSSICRQWRLYKHLQLLGLPYTLSMFKTSTMEESVTERTELWEIMCREAGDPEIYFMDD
jgi:hypothetical protein